MTDWDRIDTRQYDEREDDGVGGAWEDEGWVRAAEEEQRRAEEAE